MELFYDTETSGFNDPHIVQLAAVCGPHQMNVLIRPEGWEIEPGATEVHGITTERAEREGITIAAAMWMFNEMCSVASVRIAHNAAFDEKVVALEASRLGMELSRCEVFCTMLESMDYVGLVNKWGKPKWPKLMEAHVWATGREFDGAHDAFADLVACRAVYEKLKLMEVQ